MSAGVEEDDAALFCGLEGGDHTVEVKTFSFGGEVRVGLDGEVDVGEDLVVVGPCWCGEVDCWCGFGQKLGEEETTEMDGACARDGL